MEILVSDVLLEEMLYTNPKNENTNPAGGALRPFLLISGSLASIACQLCGGYKSLKIFIDVKI